MECKMTVFFDPPFWVGTVEVEENNSIRVARIVFGAEPTEPELLRFALERYTTLEFTRSVKLNENGQPPAGYKRRMREIRKTMETPAVSTKAQRILQQEYESKHLERDKVTRDKERAEKQQKYQIRQRHRAEKHRGR